MIVQIGTYLLAKEIVTKGKTKRFMIENKDHGIPLGLAKWYPAWRQFCFFPYQEIVMSAGCLQDVRNFLLDLNADHAKRMKEEKG